jgi:selenocysteine lyase/cysteine desulfurase
MNTFASPGTLFRPASLLALLLAVPSLPGAAPAGEPERLASMVVTGTRQLGRSVTDSLAPIGPEAKLARLRWLRDRWLQACAGDPRVRLLTRTAEEGAGAIATVELRGQDPRSIAEALRVRDGIFVRAIAHPEFRGLRVTPNLFNSAADLDRFAERLRVHLGAGG